jgi:hypothetical protein
MVLAPRGRLVDNDVGEERLLSDDFFGEINSARFSSSAQELCRGHVNEMEEEEERVII